MTPALAAYLQAVNEEKNAHHCLMHTTTLVRLVRDAHTALVAITSHPGASASDHEHVAYEALARAETMVKEGGQ